MAKKTIRPKTARAGRSPKKPVDLAKAIARLVESMTADPKRMKPGETCRLLNSTPLGTILSDTKLRKHRAAAGMRIGDGKTIDLVRYAAWLAGVRKKQQSADTVADGENAGTLATAGGKRSTLPPGAEPTGYERKKIAERQRNAAGVRNDQEIGELPEVVDPGRRAKALADPEFFMAAYFPKRFTKRMSDDQRTSITDGRRIIEHGGTKANAAPRGDGKTTRTECLALWAILSGRRRFAAIVGATRPAANDILDSLKGELETNELLLEDFPEVCYPIQCLEGTPQKAGGQKYRGEPTRIKWSAQGNMIRLPTIEGSLASGAIICVRPILGQIRGMRIRHFDGTLMRPDLALVDDPQTKGSARSEVQTKRRLDTILGDVLGLAGPGKSIACFVLVTVIERGDLADQILDRDKHPGFAGTRTKLIARWPDEEKLWEEYAALFRSGLRNDRNFTAAFALFKKHRKQMEAGGIATWPERYEPEIGEISAIQHAFNLRIERPEAFDAEYQNEPRDPTADDDRLPTAQEIAVRFSGHARGVVPLACTDLTAFIDVQQRLLYYAICGWSKQFTGTCIEYGTWPDQGRAHFLYREAAKTLPKAFPTAGVEGAIRGGLDHLLLYLAGKEFEREDGAPFRIAKIFVDSGDFTDTVYQACRESPHAAIVQPSKGMGIGPDKPPLSQWKRHEGQVMGEEWMLGRVENRRSVRLLNYDTNFWKARLFQGLQTSIGDRGAFTLYGRTGGRQQPDHSMIASHLTAETCDKLTSHKSGRTVRVFKLRPEKPDNHLFDCLVGCGVAASFLGCRLIGQPIVPQKRKASREATYFNV